MAALVLGSCWWQASPLRFHLAEWRAWSIAKAHWQCHLWSLPGTNLDPARVPQLWYFGCIFEGECPKWKWGHLQGVCCSAWPPLGSSKFGKALVRVWRYQGCRSWNGGIPQQGLQQRWGVHGERWKDPVVDLQGSKMETDKLAFESTTFNFLGSSYSITRPGPAVLYFFPAVPPFLPIENCKIASKWHGWNWNRTVDDEGDAPAKRIKIEQADACTEEDITSLKSPCQSCIAKLNK